MRMTEYMPPEKEMINNLIDKFTEQHIVTVKNLRCKVFIELPKTLHLLSLHPLRYEFLPRPEILQRYCGHLQHSRSVPPAPPESG